MWNLQGYSEISNIHKAVKKTYFTESHLTSALSEGTFGKMRIDYLISDQKKISDNRHNELIKKKINIDIKQINKA